MNLFLKQSVVNRGFGSEPKEFAGLVRHPDFVCLRVKFPYAEMSRFSGQGNALFKLIQRSLFLQYIGDIDTGADVSSKISIGPVAWHSFIRDPAIRAVM